MDFAKKPRAYVPYIKGLMNYASGHSDFPKMLFKTVELGLDEEDYNNISQYLVLLENMLTATTCPWHEEYFSQFLSHFMGEIVAGANSAYFLWMEVVLEWIFKVTGNHKIIHDWFEQN